MAVTNNGSRERQSAYRERMVAAGYVQVTGWVHRTQAPEVTNYLRALKERPDLQPGPLRNPITGKLVSTRT